jgi:hypothetical protein
MIPAKSSQEVVEMVLRWRDLGGTHASVVTIGHGFTSIDRHIDHMKKVADALRTART